MIDTSKKGDAAVVSRSVNNGLDRNVVEDGNVETGDKKSRSLGTLAGNYVLIIESSYENTSNLNS